MRYILAIVISSCVIHAEFELPRLDYDPGDLAPYISKQIMQLHHGKHHQGYVNGLLDTLSQPGFQQYQKWDMTRLLLYVDTLPNAIQDDVRFYGGGHANHAFFWRTLCPAKYSKEPTGALREAIDRDFGSYAIFQETFARVAGSVRGSGWAWLVINADGRLAVMSSYNHDTPLSQGHIPILVLDVWEHAYYLKYHNNRGDYITNWWSIVNWDFVERLYQVFAIDNEPITNWFHVVQRIPHLQNVPKGHEAPREGAKKVQSSRKMHKRQNINANV